MVAEHSVLLPLKLLFTGVNVGARNSDGLDEFFKKLLTATMRISCSPEFVAHISTPSEWEVNVYFDPPSKPFRAFKRPKAPSSFDIFFATRIVR